MQPQIRETPEKARERQGSTVREAPIAGDSERTWREWARSFAVAAAAGVFMALIGAVETGELPLGTRLLYWVPLTLAGVALGRAMSAIVRRIPRAGANPWLFGAVLAATISVPATLGVWAYTEGVFRGNWDTRSLPYFFAPVFVISAAMTALMTYVNWPGRVTHAPAQGAPTTVRFMERLPAKLRSAVIYAVSSEDHYLRLHTSKGSDLILMRLSDAISELEGLEGAQTHRSWWVARDAVENVRRDGDRLTLLLKDGAEAPVSRPNMKPLRDAGWF